MKAPRAMLLRGITQGHPFEDGNKRTGFLTAASFLRLAGMRPPDYLPLDEVVEFCVRVSAGEVRDVRIIADTLRRLWGQERTAEERIRRPGLALNAVVLAMGWLAIVIGATRFVG